jgi:two-component system, chemotaxis family, sensor kinase CheA
MDEGLERDAIVQTFLGESQEGLAVMEEVLIALEVRGDDPELLGTVFRLAHTLKGNGSSLGYDGLVHFCHTLEDLLDRLRERSLPVTSELIALLLRAVDALREMVPAAAAGAEGLNGAQERLRRQLSAHAAAATTAPAAAVDPVPEAAFVADAPPPAPAATAGGATSTSPRGLRVDMHKLDRMLDLTGEIAIARNRLRRMLVEGEASPEMIEAQGEVDRLCQDLQERVMQARLVPLRATLRQHIRTVRDLAASQGKQARLVLAGEDVEVDTSVIEHVRDPLTHMVRNAVDHGIERPELRRQRGKDPCGTIALGARHESGTIVLEISDDGAGLDRERILDRARRRGLDTTRLDAGEVQRLVFEPGFSTAEAVTELSGRGVGLDVVQRNIHALRGSVGIRSRTGEGTTITVRLPLTLAIIEGFGVAVGDETYVIPLEAVAECLELPEEAATDGDGRAVISLRGKPLPCVRLRRLFGWPGEGRREQVVVVRQDDGLQAGLVVDGLHGETQTVIKPLGRIFRGLPGISGSAILGSGRVALILDVPALLARALAGAGETSGGDGRRTEKGATACESPKGRGELRC